MKVIGAGLDYGLLHVDVVREVPEAAKLRTIKIGTTVETVQRQLRKLHAQLSHCSAPARDHDRRKSGSHRTCMGLFLSSGCFGFAVSSLFGGVSR